LTSLHASNNKNDIWTIRSWEHFKKEWFIFLPDHRIRAWFRAQ
jgi:hypothetical protein